MSAYDGQHPEFLSRNTDRAGRKRPQTFHAFSDVGAAADPDPEKNG